MKPWLMDGDCLVRMREIPDASVDMVMADLPYGKTQCAWDSHIPLEPLWAEYLRVCKRSAAIVLTAAQPFTSILVSSQLRLFRYDWTWEKTTASGHLNAKKMPLRAHESVCVFYRSLPIYNPQMTHGHARKMARNVNRSAAKGDCYGKQNGITSYDSTSRYPRSVIKTSTDKQRAALHPTQKPVALMEYLMRTYTHEGMTVLDNCMGSGTTCIAAINTKRNFIGIEKDPIEFQKAFCRIQAHLPQDKAVA